MANITLNLETMMGVSAGSMQVDEDQNLQVPHHVDETGWKRAGDVVPGDSICHPAGSTRPVVYKIA